MLGLVVIAVMLVIWLYILFRLLIERLLAAFGTEVVGLPMILRRSDSRFRIDLHSTNRVFYQHLLTSWKLLMNEIERETSVGFTIM